MSAVPKLDKANDEVVVSETPAPAEPVESADRFAHELGDFQDFRPSLSRQMGYIPEADARLVRNVPADMTVTWATDPRIDDGQHLALVQSLGFRVVRKEEVTTAQHDPNRMVLRAFADGPGDAVVVGGGVLMMGYRQYRDDRRAHARATARDRLDGRKQALDNAGVEQRGSSRSAPLSEVM